MYLNIFITCLTFSCALAHFFPLYRYQYNSPIYSTSYSSQQKPFSNNLSSGQYSAAGNVNVKPGYYSTYWYTNGGTKWRPFKYWLGRLSGLFNSGQHSANIGGYLNWKVGGGTNQYNQFNKNAGSYTLQTGGVPQYYYKGSGYTGYSGSGGYNSQYSNGGQGHYSQSSAQYGHGQTGLTDNSGGSSGRLELLYPYQHGSSSIQTQSSTSNVHTGQTSHSGQFSAGYDYGQTGLTDNSGGSSGKLELLYPYQHGSSSTQTQFSSSNVHTGQKSHPGQFSAGYDYGQTGLTDISGSSSGKLELLYPYQHGSSSTQTQSSSSNVHTGQISHSGQFSAGYDYGQTGLTDNSGGSSGKLELLYPSQHGSSSTQSSFSKVHTETKGNSNQPTDNYDLTGGTENSGKSTIEQVHTETIGNSNQPLDNIDLTGDTGNSDKSTIEQVYTETIGNSNQPTAKHGLPNGNGQLELTSPIDHSNDNQIITESKVLNLNNELPEEPIVNGQAKGTFESNKGTAVLETATESVVTVTAEIIDYNQRKTTSSSEAAIFNDTIIFPDDKRLHGTSFKANSQTEIKSTVPNSKANRSSKNGILTPGQIGASLTSVRKSENCAGQQGNTQSADSTINIALNVEKEINSKSHGNQTVPVIIKPVVVVAPIAVPSACCPNAAVPCSSACPA